MSRIPLSDRPHPPFVDPRPKRKPGALAASILLVIVALIGSGLLSILSAEPAAPPTRLYPEATNQFDQFVVVLMENHDLADIYGHATHMTQWADQYAFAQHWESLTNPSQPNYIGLIGGSLFGVSGDGNHPNLNHPTIVDIIENSGHTWKAFAEDASGSGCGLHPPRGEDHFPFLSYTTITGNSSRCANLVSGSGPEVIAAFNAGTSFIWLTPNDCNNMHSCSVTTGDNWLNSWVPDLLTAMAGKKAALLLTYDEGYANPPLIYHAFIGPAAKPAYKSTASYNHYSFIKLLEDVWGGGNLGQGDVGAASPIEFFLDSGSPPPPPPPPGQTQTSLALTTSKNPSQAEEIVTVSGRLLDANQNGIPSQTVVLEWSWDQVAWSRESQIGQFPPTDATGAFSGTLAFHGTANHTEYLRAQYAGAGSGSYQPSTSPVVTQQIFIGAPPSSTPPSPPPPSWFVLPDLLREVPLYVQAIGLSLLLIGVAAIRRRLVRGQRVRRRQPRTVDDEAEAEDATWDA